MTHTRYVGLYKVFGRDISTTPALLSENSVEAYVAQIAGARLYCVQPCTWEERQRVKKEGWIAWANHNSCDRTYVAYSSHVMTTETEAIERLNHLCGDTSGAKVFTKKLEWEEDE